MGRRGEDYYKIVDLLRAHGAKLDRSKKHHVFKVPDGHIWVIPGSPRDSNGHRNNLADLKKYLGITIVKPPSKERPRKPGRNGKVQMQFEPVPLRPTWKDTLRQIPKNYRSHSLVPQRVTVTPVRVILGRLLDMVKP